MNETKRLFDDEDQEKFYLLIDLWKTVTMDTTVINNVTATDWSGGFVFELIRIGLLIYTANMLNLLSILWISRKSDA